MTDVWSAQRKTPDSLHVLFPFLSFPSLPFPSLHGSCPGSCAGGWETSSPSSAASYTMHSRLSVSISVRMSKMGTHRLLFNALDSRSHLEASSACAAGQRCTLLSPLLLTRLCTCASHNDSVGQVLVTDDICYITESIISKRDDDGKGRERK